MSQIRLSAEAHRVLREQGTERPFSSSFHAEASSEGTYSCAGCGADLFHSVDQFNAGCGWPSFDRPSNQKSITAHHDVNHGMVRTEVRCAKCDGHLGHIFDDGPTSTGKRFCINGICLAFESSDKHEADGE